MNRKFVTHGSWVFLLSLSCWSVPALSQVNSDLDLSQVLARHEAQLARVSTLRSTWTVGYSPSGQKQTYHAVITPNSEAGTCILDASARGGDYYRWDGNVFEWVRRFDAKKYEKDSTSIRSAIGLLYHHDVPLQRMFQWRTLRAFRVYANERDQSLRQLCEQSPQAPKLSYTNGFIRIEVTHPGTEQIAEGSSITVDVDPHNGYLVRRYLTTANSQGEEKKFTQQLEVEAFQEISNDLFLPTTVCITLRVGDVTQNQRITLAYTNVNEPLQANETIFVEDLLVSEYSDDGKDPIGFYVINTNGGLGERIDTEREASAMQSLRLLEHIPRNSPLLENTSIYALRTQVEAQIEAEKSAPGVGDAAPPLGAANLRTGALEEVVFHNRVTVLEFWATWCGPCQGTMKELNDIAAQKCDEWQDRVQLITIGVDEDREKALQHAQSRKWLRTHNLFDAPDSAERPK